MEAQEANSRTTICVPKNDSTTVLGKIAEKGYSAKELSPEEMKTSGIIAIHDLDKNYTMITLFHPKQVSAVEIMQDILKRVL
jgi:hypothetical protein